MSKRQKTKQPHTDHDIMITLLANQEADAATNQKILEQVMLTNGRVSKLENWQSGHNEHHVSVGKIIEDLCSDVGQVLTYQNKQKGAWNMLLIIGSLLSAIIGFGIAMIFF